MAFVGKFEMTKGVVCRSGGAERVASGMSKRNGFGECQVRGVSVGSVTVSSDCVRVRGMCVVSGTV